MWNVKWLKLRTLMMKLHIDLRRRKTGPSTFVVWKHYLWNENVGVWAHTHDIDLCLPVQVFQRKQKTVLNSIIFYCWRGMIVFFKPTLSTSLLSQTSLEMARWGTGCPSRDRQEQESGQCPPKLHRSGPAPGEPSLPLGWIYRKPNGVV